MRDQERPRHRRSRKKNSWLFLLYLCDDFSTHDFGSTELWKAVDAIEKLKSLNLPIDVVYQYDSYNDIDQLELPGGTREQDQHCIRRHLSWPGDEDLAGREDSAEDFNWQLRKHASYKSMNTGETETLKEFFHWAQEPITSASNVVVIFAGLGVGDKQSIVGNLSRENDFGRIFSICDDNSEKDALNPMELQDALETLVNDYRGGDPIDLLGFDMSSMQFIEVAYQFLGIAQVMVASQNNRFDPFWPYDRLLVETAKHIPQEDNHHLGPTKLGSVFVEQIGRVFERSSKHYQRRTPNDMLPIVSALDLSQLDIVTRSLDTLFLNLLQALGDTGIWIARDEVFKRMRQSHQAAYDADQGSASLISYDIHQMLCELHYQLERVNTPERMLLAWYEDRLRGAFDPDDQQACAHFDRIAARCAAPDDCDVHQDPPNPRSPKSSGQQVRENVEAFLSARTGLATSEMGEDDSLWRSLQLLYIDVHSGDVSCPCLQDLDRQIVTAANPKRIKAAQYQHPDEKVRTDIFFEKLKEGFGRLSWQQLAASANTARHLCEVAQEVISLIAPPAEADLNVLGLMRSKKATTRDKPRYIVALYSPSLPPEDDAASGENIRPLEARCGVSIYRPEHLDRLTKSQYLDFAFHRRVHWVSLLGAINLIRKHPGQLWNVLSSLLATCTGSARDELLMRLSGPKSLASQFGKQFQALQNPLTLTLTVAENKHGWSTGSSQSSDLFGVSAAAPKETQEQSQHWEQDAPTLNYKLTLESNLQDASAEVGRATLNRRRVERSQERLEAIISGKSRDRFGMDTMQAFARDLGEDIFQELDLHKYARLSDAVPHLQLQLPVELMGLPWEVKDDGNGMLCERFAISRQTLLDSGVARQPSIRSSSKIRVLIIGDPLLDPEVMERWQTGQLPEALDEAAEVASLFRQLARDLRGTIELCDEDIFLRKRITGHDVRKLLRSSKYDIIHYAGHAFHNEANPEQSFWLMSDGGLWASEIRNTLRNCDSPPWLVYANACEAGMASTQRESRTNVFGLGTAFTNEGVTAYLGPLWPIGDFVAGQLATDFYSGLLLERTTVGEALFVAKRNAKQRLEGSHIEDLSWASMIAYGDSRMKLLDSLGPNEASGQAENAHQFNTERRSEYEQRLSRLTKVSPSGVPVQPMQASVRSTHDIVDEDFVSSSKRGATDAEARLEEDQFALQLRQINGIRYWEFCQDNESDYQGLPGSPIRQAIESNESLQFRLGLRGDITPEEDARLIGHWKAPRKPKGFLDTVVHSMERNAVPAEGLVRIGADGDLHVLDGTAVRRLARKLSRKRNGRVLLLLHNGLSSAREMTEALGLPFIRQAGREYVATLAFDHRSLQRDISDVTEDLTQQLEALFEDGRKFKDIIDIIGFGRGGLVGRALVEQDATMQKMVRKLALVATPNFGSRIARPEHWGRVADLLINSIHLDVYGKSYARLSHALALLSAYHFFHPKKFSANATKNSLDRMAKGLRLTDSIAGRGDAADGVEYLTVACAYAPGSTVSVPRILQEHCSENPYFERPHDFFVSIDDSGALDTTWLANNQSADPHSLLILPKDPSFYPQNDLDLLDREHLSIHRQDGVHHANVLGNEAVHEFLSKHLFESE